jgi:polysaccharide export outer membrane protein
MGVSFGTGHCDQRHVMKSLFSLFLLISVAAPAGATPEQAPQQPLSSTTGHPAAYTLQVGDSVEIVFLYTPEFNQTATIRPDGQISLNGIRDLTAAGLAPDELLALVTRGYASLLRDPVVTLSVKNFVKPYFIVGGQVINPGKYELHGRMSVLQAIAMAGGFNESSKHSQVLLLRQFSDHWVEVQTLDLKKMVDSLDLRPDVHLRSGDTLFVPKSRLSKISRFLPIPSAGLFLNPF